MGSPTGDGAIAALQHKPALRYFSSGKLVTDAGLRMLHNFPRLRTWHGGENDGAHLLIDGPFTDEGLASLAGLDGVFELDLFWHVTGITTAGFAHLVNLPNLGALGADGALSDDVAMRHFAALPRLRKLRAQGTVATDDGFEALSRSKTLEALWGRECPNLGSRGFVALSKTAGPACAWRELQERRRPGAVRVAAVSGTSGAHADRRARRRLRAHRPLRATGTPDVHVLPRHDRRRHRARRRAAAPVLLRGVDADHRPQPGDSRPHAVTGAGRVVRMLGRDRCRTRVPGRPATAARGPPGRAAGSDA